MKKVIDIGVKLNFKLTSLIKKKNILKWFQQLHNRRLLTFMKIILLNVRECWNCMLLLLFIWKRMKI